MKPAEVKSLALKLNLDTVKVMKEIVQEHG